MVKIRDAEILICKARKLAYKEVADLPIENIQLDMHL